MAFPDVDPYSIAIPQVTISRRYQDNRIRFLSRTVREELTDSFSKPHLWYSTSEVIEALELFLSSGDEVPETSIYRSYIQLYEVATLSTNIYF